MQVGHLKSNCKCKFIIFSNPVTAISVAVYSVISLFYKVNVNNCITYYCKQVYLCNYFTQWLTNIGQFRISLVGDAGMLGPALVEETCKLHSM